MVSIVRNLLCVTILAVLVSTGYAIHCYNSTYNGNFEETFEANENNLIDCNSIDYFLEFGNATGCMKLTVQPQSVIVRRCYFGDVNNEQGCQLSIDLNEEKELTCDICFKDACNGSASLAQIGSAIIIFFGVALKSA